MQEVELTSELAILMLRGLRGKTKVAIDTMYKDKNATFQERYELQRRFMAVMDTIEGKFAAQIRFSPFRRKTLFHSLFAFVYDVQFGIGSLLVARKPKSVSPATVAKIRSIGDGIMAKTVPSDVLDAVARRTTHAISRTTVHKYLRRETGNETSV